MVGKKWGYVNTSGNLIVDAEVFSEDGLAPVKLKNWGFIDTTGKIIIPTEYDITAASIGSIFGKEEKGFIDGLVRVKNSKKKWGFLDTKGQLFTGRWFDNAELFKQ